MVGMNIQHFIEERLMAIALIIVAVAFVIVLIGAACLVMRSDKRSG